MLKVVKDRIKEQKYVLDALTIKKAGVRNIKVGVAAIMKDTLKVIKGFVVAYLLYIPVSGC